MKTHLQWMKENAPFAYDLCKRLAGRLDREFSLACAYGYFSQETSLDDDASMSLALATSCLVWGQQCFEVPPELSRLLMATDLSGVGIEDIRLPYNTFYVKLPDCGITFSGQVNGEPHRVLGVYVGCDDSSGSQALGVSLWSDTSSASSPGSMASSWVLIYPHEGEDIEQCLQRSILEDGEQQATLSACRLALNLVMYLASDQAETEIVEPAGSTKLRAKLAKTKSTKKAAKLRQTLRKLEGQRVTLVGRKLAQRYREAVTAASRGGVTPHWVRGHYRTYWTGAGRKQRVRKWVMPFPRGFGDEDAPIEDHERSYKVR